MIEDGKFYLTGEGWKAAPTGYFNMFDRIQKKLYKTHDGNNSQLITGKAEEYRQASSVLRKTKHKPPKGTYTLWRTLHDYGINITGSKDDI